MPRDAVNADAGTEAQQPHPGATTPAAFERHGDGKRRDGKRPGSDRGQSTKQPPRWPGYVEAVCAFVLVVITGTYTYYMRGSLAESQNLSRYEAQANTAARMPFVFPDGGIEVKEIVNQAGTHVFRLRLKVVNKGETPAIHPIFQWGYGYEPPSYDPKFIWKPNQTWQQSMWPNGIYGDDFEEVQVKDFKLPIYFYGTTRYLDVFPVDPNFPHPGHNPNRNDHLVQWCVKITGIVDKKLDGIVSPQGSCIDDRCGSAYIDHPYDQ